MFNIPAKNRALVKARNMGAVEVANRALAALAETPSEMKDVTPEVSPDFVKQIEELPEPLRSEVKEHALEISYGKPIAQGILEGVKELKKLTDEAKSGEEKIAPEEIETPSVEPIKVGDTVILNRESGAIKTKIIAIHAEKPTKKKAPKKAAKPKK